MRSCLTQSAVTILPQWWDSAYFYKDDEGLGHSTCGVVRDRMAWLLRRYGEAKFLDDIWFEALHRSCNNPAVLGFIVKQMCLTSIAQSGLPIGRKNFYPVRTIVFGGRDPPAIDKQGGVSLYVPLRFNFPAIDAILIEVEEEKKTVLLIPLQITIAERHSASEDKFFETWAKWERKFYGYKVSLWFVWVTEGIRSRVESHPERKKDRRRGIAARNAVAGDPVGSRKNEGARIRDWNVRRSERRATADDDDWILQKVSSGVGCNGVSSG